MVRLSACLLALCLALPASAQPAQPRASMAQMVLPSHGRDLLGIFYLAAGAGPHPTAILFHGFPGYEQNLDIAQALRRAGWNVLAMHYRGSWGAGGDFSFAHCVEDADTQVRFVLDPANAARYRIDTHKVIVIGHSMGGFIAASAAAHNPAVRGAVLISAWNIGATDPEGTEAETVKFFADRNDLAPLAGTSPSALGHEVFADRADLEMNRFAAAVASRPVLVITANDGLRKTDEAFAAALRTAGDRRVETAHWDTDHSYSEERLALAARIVEWAQPLAQ
jgi:uncharacterized protein